MIRATNGCDFIYEQPVTSPLPDGWMAFTTRTIGGLEIHRVEHYCGQQLRATVRLGDLLDHHCVA